MQDPSQNFLVSCLHQNAMKLDKYRGGTASNLSVVAAPS